MQSIEVTAKTLDEATQQAAKQLGVSTDQLTVRVLEQSKGLFGRGSVRIKATVDLESAVDAPEPTPAPVPEQSVEPAPEPVVKASKPKPEPKPKAEKPSRTEPAQEPADQDESEETESSSVIATDKDANFLLERLQAFIEAADLDVRAEVREISGKYVNIGLDGKDSSFLVGKHGEVINALQYLINIVSNQHLKNGVRASLDCNDYRRRREEALTKLATNIAVEVRNRGEEAVLDALPAFERRVVHKALQEFDGVTTYSEGEEPNRRVVIAPRD